ncbi:MAG: TetR/AcrR family transcriptional regulator [Acidimicrobiales bacterium]
MVTRPDADVAGTPAWWLERGQRSVQRRNRKDGLTVERIIEQALAVVEAEGAERLTIRRLAEVLGTGPASLYRHVATREEIIALVVDRFLEPLGTQEPPPGLAWQERARWLAVKFREHLLDHTNVVPLMVEAQMLGPNSMAGRQRVLRGFLKAGLDAESAIRAYLAIVHFTVASVQLEIQRRNGTAADRKALQRLFASQDPDRYPDVVANAELLAGEDSDLEFRFALNALLQGIDNLRK